MPEALSVAIDWLTKFDKYLLIIHQNPDGDAVASALALQAALLKKNKIVSIVCKDLVPKPFRFLDRSDTIKQDFLQGDWDVVVVLDCGDLKRTGFPTRIKDFSKRRHRVINIDHHLKNDLHKIANCNLFDVTAAATGEIIADLINKMGIEIDKDIATDLLTAIYTDTGGFKHPNTSQKTLELASRLMASGARLKKITEHISSSKTVQSLKLWGIVLSRIQKHKTLGIMVSVITQKDLNLCNATVQDLDGAVNLIGSATGTTAAMLLAEYPDGQIKASLRTDADNVDVSKIAQVFGGGGHKKASGFTIPGRIFKDGGKWTIITK